MALTAAADAFRRSGDSKQQATTRHALGIVLGELHQYHAAAEQFLEAAEVFSEIGDSGRAAQAWLARGCAFGLGEELDDATAAFATTADILASSVDDSAEAAEFRARLRVKTELCWLDTLAQKATTESGGEAGDAVLEHCDSLLSLIDDTSSAELRDAVAKASYHKARLLVRRGDLTGAISHAREAAKLLEGSPNAEEREARVEMLVAVGAASLLKRRDEPSLREGEIAYTSAAELGDGLGDHACTALALRGLARLLRDDSSRATARFESLAEYFEKRGSSHSRAVCLFEAAAARAHTPRASDVSCDVAISRQFEEAAVIFDALGDAAAAGDAYYFAGTERSWASLVAPDQREEAIALLDVAAQRFADSENPHGRGLALNAEALLESRWDPDREPDDAAVRSLLEESIASFRRAERPAEEATSLAELAAFLGIRDGSTDQWMDTALAAVRQYEQGRAAQLLPPERETHDDLSWGGFLLLASTAWQCADQHKESDPRWRELVWALENVLKARAFQDRQRGSDVWQRFLTNDLSLRQSTAALEQGRLALEQARRERDGQRVDKARSAIQSARHALRERLEELGGANESMLSLASSPPVSDTRLQALLSEGELYIGFLKAGRGILRTAVSRNCIRFDALEAGELSSLLADASPGWSWVGADSNPVLLEAAELLGQLDSDVRTLLICPDRDLVQVPWHLVPGPTGAFLGEEVSLAVLPSAGVLAHLREPPRKGREPAPFAAYLGVSDNSQGLGCVDWEVENIRSTYFPRTGRCLTSGRASDLLDEHGHAELFHLACHASAEGLVFGDRDVTAVDLADIPLTARILLLTGCHAGAFGGEENNEFFGVVRQLLVSTGARAAVVSFAAVPDASGPVFSDLFVSALTNHARDRPWSLPAENLSVGRAVGWARAQMRELRPKEAEPLIPDQFVAVTPHDPSWWSPWFVVGDPATTLTVGGLNDE